MSPPAIEFSDGSRPPVLLSASEVVIGKAAGCLLRLATAGVGDQHARIFTDEAGISWLEDLGSRTGTLLNGKRVDAWEQLNEGDRVDVGASTLIFRLTAPANAPPKPTEARTMIEMEAPAAVKELVAKMKASAAAKPAPISAPMPKVSAEGRTMQMDAQELAPAMAQAPPVAKAPVRGRSSTVMGMGEHAGVPIRPIERPTPAAAPQYQPPAPVAAPQYQPPAPAHAAPQQPIPVPAWAESPQETVQNFAHPSQDGGGQQWGASPMPTPAGQPAGYPQPQQQFTPEAQQPQQGWNQPQAQPPQQAWNQPQAQPPQQGWNQPQAQPQPQGWDQQQQAQPPQQQGWDQQSQQQQQQGWGQPQAQPQQQGWGGAPAAGGGSSAGWANQPYTPPAKKGPLGSISRALDFYQQMFALGMQHKGLLTPLVYDLAITTVLSIFLSLITIFVRSASVYYLLVTVGTGLLYFIDYACNSLTASLIYDQITTGQSNVKDAMPRVQKAIPGIVTFAAVAGLLDMASTWARERHDPLARILLDIIRKIWSTATYVIMPAMVLEGVSFSDAFKRSKDLMAQDPTGVGSGVVALSLTSYVVGFVAFSFASFSLRFGAYIHPAVGMFFFFFFVNAYWSVSGWLKISYSTLFYMWAAECEKSQSHDFALAPIPLRHALDAA